MSQPPDGEITLKLAIVGGGRACEFFLKLLSSESLPFLRIDIVGVCDINPEAEGLRLARQLGIYTTTDFRDLFALKDLDGIIELTNNRDVLMELIQNRPDRVGIVEHNVGRLLRNLFMVDQKLRFAEQQIVFEETIRDFLIHQNQQRIVVINADFTIAAANDAYLRNVGQTGATVIGNHCYRIIHGFDAPCDPLRNGLTCPMLETLRTGEPTQVIHPVAAGDGMLTFNDIVTYPVRDPNGKTVRIIEIWRDIAQDLSSRWEKREQELKSDLNKLIQEDRLISLGKLVASCVHEINNPIQGLLTFSHLMKKMLVSNALTEGEVTELRAFADIMAEELERCGKIISGLLSFSRETHNAYKDIDLNEVISSVADLIRHRIELQDQIFRLDMTAEPLFVHGDTNRLQQCFLNLLFNAIEAMGPGGRLEIVSCRRAAQQVAEVQIRDTGQGISQNHLNHIFDPFFTTKAMGEGTGMGLSIVYGVVKSHQGEISVHSDVGKGTTFTIQFPLASSAAARKG